ncbi:MAG TPA: adenylate/guanylate cyclase domain-containing protein, partial [Acidimicrobiia bacterium]|nr:adenylate/guanylate cyclase domain-containing protein [Acidimicrobiia bacterium]
TMPASPWLDYADGTLDVKILGEEALALAVLTGTPAGHTVRTVVLTFKHLRPATMESTSFIARARTLNQGPRFAVAEVLVEDVVGRAIAHATASVAILPIEIDRAAPALQPVDEPTYPTPDPYRRPLPTPVPIELLDETDGLSIAKRLATGDLVNPVLALIGGWLAAVEDRSAAWAITSTEWLCSRERDIAPGVLAVLAHASLGGSVLTMCQPGDRVGLVDQTVSFLRPAPATSGDLVCRARVAHEGEILTCTGEITDAAGTVVAHAHQTGLVRRPARSRHRRSEQRVLTVVFTDIVGSTNRAADIGDSRWKDLLDKHHATVRRHLQALKGREIKTTGDGFLATFDNPAVAVEWSRRICDAVRSLGLQVRVGIHSGQCEVSDGDVSGIAVHLAARVLSLAGPSEVLVSGTVRDLLLGSAVTFEDRGRHQLKGFEGDWHLFAITA